MLVTSALLACAAAPVAPMPREAHRWVAVATLKHPRPVVAVAVSADRVATADDGGAVVLWDARTGAEVQTLFDHKASAAPVTRLRFSPGGAWLHLVTHDGTRCHVCECRKPKQTQVFATAKVTGPWRVLDVGTDAPRWALVANDKSLWWHRVATDATAPLGPQDDPFVLDQEANAGRLSHLAATDAVLVTLSNGVLRGRFADRTEKPWRVTLSGAEPTDLALAPNGERAAVTDARGAVRVFNAANGQSQPRPAGHDRAAWAVAFDPDGTRLVTGGADRTARVWEAATGGEIAVLKGHTGGVRAVAFSPDGKRIVTAGDDKTARIWVKE
jgi:WD40 repeat protein